MNEQDGIATGGAGMESPERSLGRHAFELELLISGAIVISLFQVPSLLTSFFSNLELHTSNHLMDLLGLFYAYVKLMVYVLIFAFSVHLMGRFYWVGLIGLGTVFPEGVQWDRLNNYGPHAKAFFKRRILPLDQAAKRADRFCSSLFSLSFAAILYLLVTILLALISGPFLLMFEKPNLAFVVLLLSIGLPLALLNMADKFTEKAPGRRWLNRGFPRLFNPIQTVYYYGFLAPLAGPILLPFASNLKKRTQYVLVILLLSLFVTVLVVGEVVSKKAVSIHSYTHFPAADSSSIMDPNHYEDLRAGMSSIEMVPTIQSQILRDPFIRLFIPYQPRADNSLIQKLCPDVTPLGHDGIDLTPLLGSPETTDQQVQENLACLVSLYTLSIGDQPLKDLDFEFYVDPQTEMRGVLTLIPLQGIPPGKHEVWLERAQTRAQKERQAKPLRIRIPFWVVDD